MSEVQLTGVVNPYALAEFVLGRPVFWDRLPDPFELLESTLKTPRDRLFDGATNSLPFLHLALADQPGVIERLAGLPAALGEASGKELMAFLRGDEAGSGNGVPHTAPGTVWVDVGNFFAEGCEYSDPVQGAVGDCYLIAALSAVAWSRPYVVVHRTRQVGPGQQQFVDAIDFYRTPNTATRFEVSERVPVKNGTQLPAFARSSETGEIWPGVYEKAYTKFRTGNTTDQPDILALAGGDPVAASAELVAGTTGHRIATAGSTPAAIAAFIQGNCSTSGRTVSPMTAWTYAKAADAPDKIAYDQVTGIVGWHAYTILGIIRTAHGPYVVLRNPWGQHEGKVDVLGGSFTSLDVSFFRSITLNTAGVFAMRVDSFKKYYRGLGVAK